MSSGNILNGARVVARLRGIGQALPDRVLRTVTEFALDVTNQAKRNAPLKTGRLRRSIHMGVTRGSGRVNGMVGTNVEYAGAIERGLKGSQSVREFVRSQTMAWGHPITPLLVSVRPFARNVNRPARPFLAPALAEVRPTLLERLEADLAALRGSR
jgi:phage gpG-like protein